MAKFGFGQAMRRVEDPRLLTGRGRYTDDIVLDGQTYGVFVRSPVAHAVIVSIDLDEAAAAPGVIGIVTGAEMDAAGIGTIQCMAPAENRDGRPFVAPRRPTLATDRVRFVGEAVVLVVAETLDQARDAADLVLVDYDPLDTIADTAGALADGAPVVWPDLAPDNEAFDWQMGDRDALDSAFAKADRVITLDLVNNRLIANSLEARACYAAYEAETDSFSLYVSSQGVHLIKRQLADMIFGIPPERVRVLTTDVGGGFGMKIFMYPEYVAVAYAAKSLGRPVRWASDRTEAFVSDDHGRDHVTRAEMALDGDARILGLKVDTIANMGAYLSNFAPFVATDCGAPMLSGLYAMEHVVCRVRGAYTNTQPVDAYRGAGRPEASYLVERIIDKAARELGISPVEMRKRNFHTTVGNALYDRHRRHL